MKLIKRHLALPQEIMDGHTSHWPQQAKTADNLRSIGLIVSWSAGYNSQIVWMSGEEASRTLANPRPDRPFVCGERSRKSTKTLQLEKL